MIVYPNTNSNTISQIFEEIKDILIEQYKTEFGEIKEKEKEYKRHLTKNTIWSITITTIVSLIVIVNLIFCLSSEHIDILYVILSVVLVIIIPTLVAKIGFNFCKRIEYPDPDTYTFMGKICDDIKEKYGYDLNQIQFSNVLAGKNIDIEYNFNYIHTIEKLEEIQNLPNASIKIERNNNDDWLDVLVYVNDIYYTTYKNINCTSIEDFNILTQNVKSNDTYDFSYIDKYCIPYFERIHEDLGIDI